MTTQIRAMKKGCSAVSIVGFKCEFVRRQVNPDLLQNARERVFSVNRQEPGSWNFCVKTKKGFLWSRHTTLWVPTESAFYLSTRPSWRETLRLQQIFPAPAVIAHRLDCSSRDILVHTSNRSQTDTRNFRMSTSPLPPLPIRNVHLLGPKWSNTIRERFACRCSAICNRRA